MASLVVSIIGLVLLLTTVVGGVLAPVGLIMGLVSRSKIKQAPPNTYRNTGLTTAAIIIGAVSCVLLVVFIAGIFAIFASLSNLEQSLWQASGLA